MNEESNLEDSNLNNQPSEVGSGIWGMVKVFIVALAIVLPIRYYIAQPFIVRGSSMEPNFLDRDYLVVDEVTYRFREPQRNEAIVLRYPNNPNEFFIKRVIGLPGETVEIKNGEVKIKNSSNPEGLVLAQPYLSPDKAPTYPDVISQLKSGEYFVLGDNRPFSSDSRIWGILPRNMIIGRAAFRVVPLIRMGFINNSYASN